MTLLLLNSVITIITHLEGVVYFFVFFFALFNQIVQILVTKLRILRQEKGYTISKDIFSVTERSEDTGLVYPLSVVRRAERSKLTMKDYFSFDEQHAIAEN